MTVLLQVSDPHFGTERPQVVQALLALAARERPELVVLSGDITQRARRAQFDAAHAFVARLPAPVLALPGNHDVPLFNLPARLLRPYAGHQRVFGPDLEPRYESASLLVQAVKTTRRWRHKHGQVSAAQIERVAQRLQQAQPGQLRVVVVHQPVAVTRESERVNLLRGHAAAVQAWCAAGCDIVMGGHIHLPYVLPLAPPPRPAWAVQAGTSVSRRVRDGIPNSVNLLRWDGRECCVERWDHDTAAGEFRLQGRTALALRP